ncbi:modulator of macroautophagy TMEM150B isoform 2-T2 [Hipposideros larvatus]
MWGYLSMLPAFLALWAAASIWTVFAIAVANRTVNLTEGIPYISLCGSYPPQSCIFGQLLNMGAAMAAWICILRYHQLRDWGVGKWFNQLILWSGLLCALGTSVVGNFQVFPSTIPTPPPAKEPAGHAPDGGLLRLFCGPSLLLAAAPSVLEDEELTPARGPLDQATPPGPLQPLHHPYGDHGHPPHLAAAVRLCCL